MIKQNMETLYDNHFDFGRGTRGGGQRIGYLF